jgi:hypothetical protein
MFFPDFELRGLIVIVEARSLDYTLHLPGLITSRSLRLAYVPPFSGILHQLPTYNA